jgi:hypothetical protein
VGTEVIECCDGEGVVVVAGVGPDVDECWVGDRVGMRLVIIESWVGETVGTNVGELVGCCVGFTGA